MVVLILERVSAGKRGELTRWLLEPKSGVFVGNVSARVRDKLWKMVCGDMAPDNGGMLIYSTSETEQGFIIKTCGITGRTLVDIEGLFLVKITQK
jgi:CRISPR-associated protein Cas2